MSTSTIRSNTSARAISYSIEDINNEITKIEDHLNEEHDYIYHRKLLVRMRMLQNRKRELLVQTHLFRESLTLQWSS